jgi:cytochrome c553
VGPGPVLAADDGVAVEGSVSKGKYFFKKTCKSCHTNKDEGGEVTPISKTMKQWERYFDRDVHRKFDQDGETVKEPLEAVAGDEKLDAIEDEDARNQQLQEKLLHIRTFLIHHAADSDQPETCG